MLNSGFKNGHIPWNKGFSIRLNPKGEFKKGIIPWNKGKKSTYSLIHLGQFKKGYSPFNKGMKLPNISGENHHNWQGGYSKSQHKGVEYDVWRMAVYTRDDFKCKIANEDCEGKIEAHHILGFTKFPELRYELKNGITLCHAHHPRKRAEEKLIVPDFQRLLGLSRATLFQ